MYTYTKQEVQEFLETKTTVNNNLLDGLQRKGFVAETNNKRGTNLLFILDKELVDPIIEEFGFKPIRPNTTRLLIQVLADLGGTTTMNWTELNNYIKEHYDKTPGASHLSTAYRELVEYGTATDITSVELFDKSTGELATEEQVKEFRKLFYRLMGQDYPVGIAYNLALVYSDLRKAKIKEMGAF